MSLSHRAILHPLSCIEDACNYAIPMIGYFLWCLFSRCNCAKFLLAWLLFFLCFAWTTCANCLVISWDALTLHSSRIFSLCFFILINIFRPLLEQDGMHGMNYFLFWIRTSLHCYRDNFKVALLGCLPFMFDFSLS